MCANVCGADRACFLWEMGDMKRAECDIQKRLESEVLNVFVNMSRCYFAAVRSNQWITDRIVKWQLLC